MVRHGRVLGWQEYSFRHRDELDNKKYSKRELRFDSVYFIAVTALSFC